MCVIDRYRWSLTSICHDCRYKNRDKDNHKPHSCEKYPNQDGIPAKIWNGDVRECKHFKKKSNTVKI